MYLFLKWEEGLEGGEIIQGRERGGILVPLGFCFRGDFFPLQVLGEAGGSGPAHCGHSRRARSGREEDHLFTI